MINLFAYSVLRVDGHCHYEDPISMVQGLNFLVESISFESLLLLCKTK